MFDRPPEVEAKLLIKYLDISLTEQRIKKSLVEMITRENAINFALKQPNANEIIKHALALIIQKNESGELSEDEANQLTHEINLVINKNKNLTSAKNNSSI